MDKTTSVLGALEAGKLPSTQQFTQFIDWLNDDIIPKVEPGSDSELSEQGRVLAVDARRLLDAYKQLAQNKNPDNDLQKALYHLSTTDLTASAPTPTTHAKSEKDKALSDLQALRVSLRHILYALWESISLEGTSLSQDLLSAVRLSLADAAELVEGQAGSVKDSLREVEGEVQEGKRDALGRDKQRLEEEKDPKVAWEHGMDTVKGAGSSVIETAQETAETVKEKKDKGSDRLEEAFYKISDRAQSNPEYRDSLSTLLGILQSRLHSTLDAASKPDATLSSFFSDPSDTDNHVPEALGHLRVLLERLAGDNSLTPLLDAARECMRSVAADKELRQWFDDMFSFARKTLSDPAKAVGAPQSEEEAKKVKEERKDLKKRWNALLEKKENGKWKHAVDNLKAELDKLQAGLEHDADLTRVKDAQTKLGNDLERVLGKVGDEVKARVGGVMGEAEDKAEGVLGRAQEIGGEMVQGALWFWQDMFKVYVPKMLAKMRDVPIPRTEYKDDQIEFVLENLDISSFNLLPSHVYIRNITDLDISTSATPGSSTKTKVGTLTHIKIQALQLTLNDVSFWYKDKTATIGPAEFTGLLGMKVPERGVEIDLKVRYVPPSSQNRLGTGLRAKRGPGSIANETEGHYHTIEHLSVSLAPDAPNSDDFSVTVRESNHALLVTLFRPIVAQRLKEALERAMEAQIRAGVEWVDGVVWDVGKRREVFEDAGLGWGKSLMPAVWSEMGRLRREGSSGGWTMTGTGVVLETSTKSVEEGEDGEGEREVKTGKSTFAMGVEPQILSGEKRGPLGTGSEPLAKKVQRVAGAAADQMNVDINLDTVTDTDVDMDAGANAVAHQASAAASQAKGVMGDVMGEVRAKVGEGKERMDGFWRSVERKRGVELAVGAKGGMADEEGEGWRSAAFDL